MSAGKISIREALDVAEADAPGKCPTCTGLADEGQRYCMHCRMYWEDVEKGLYDEPWSSGWADQDDEGEPA